MNIIGWKANNNYIIPHFIISTISDTVTSTRQLLKKEQFLISGRAYRDEVITGKSNKGIYDPREVISRKRFSKMTSVLPIA